ncbi:MAG TPA: Rieske (2Fe-2S) protein [Puia sp.]|nr:Rieske (2Fe-2S) protein [Puia sp.]
MERREFIKSSCNNLCMLLTAGLVLPMLPGCGPAAYQVIHTEVSNDLITIPLTSFTQYPLQLVRPKGWLYAIAVRKKEDNTYSALLMKCTHQDNQLTASGSGFSCSLHGSAFNTEGTVTKGPAEKALKQYSVSADQTNLTIHLKAS